MNPAPRRMFALHRLPAMTRLLSLLLVLAAATCGASEPAEAQVGAQRFSARANAPQDPEPLLAIDSLFSIDNRGLTRIFVTLNEHRFKLVTDPEEVDRSANAFPISQSGFITIDIADLLNPDDEDPFDDVCAGPNPNGNNCIDIVSQGPEGTDAQLIISDTPLAGQEIAYAITRDDLAPIPQAFGLLQSYPNPFVDRATLTYDIPADRTNGVPVSLVIYDLVGRRVRVLASGLRFPGTFTVEWDGNDARGQHVASGLYLCRLTAGAMSETTRLTRLR